jgi:type IV secretion system protein VirB6
VACAPVTTGSRFLADTLSHLDCQAQTIGSFGFQSLASPGSPASLALAGLLTLFIALFAIRLLFASDVEPRDAVGGVLKIAIVLTLAVSWPAFRTLAYDTVLRGPAEVAAAITPTSLPDSRAGFAERLQNIDGGIASLTAAGVGRQTGSLELEAEPQGAFQAIALEDRTAFGWARTFFLGSVIGSLTILRLGGGLLLALTPLFAGLLLFELTRGLFAGWLRGLVLVALGSLGMTVVLAAEVALLEPWLADALNRRNLGYATPAAATELLALTLSFALASAGILFLLAKVAFQNAWPPAAMVGIVDAARATSALQPRERAAAHARIPVHSRALAISESVTANMQREELSGTRTSDRRRIAPPDWPDADQTSTAVRPYTPEPLGEGYRRNARRQTGSQTRRDGTR